MSMFCFQCQEATKSKGCTLADICGKKDDVATIPDVLVKNFGIGGISSVNKDLKTMIV